MNFKQASLMLTTAYFVVLPLLVGAEGVASRRPAGAPTAFVAHSTLAQTAAQKTADAPAPPPSEGGPNAEGIYKIGGDVRPPVLVHQVNPKFSRKDRHDPFSGIVRVALIVDRRGMPQNVHLVKRIGMDLDEKALEAVRRYRFRPAMKGDTPVPVELYVDVSFQIF